MSYVLLSTCVFPATGVEPFDGYVEVEGSSIVAVGPRDQAARALGRAVWSADFGARTLMPGLVDDHTFFTGWAAALTGADMAGVSDAAGLTARLAAWGADRPGTPVLLGRELAGETYEALDPSILDDAFGDRAACVFTEGRDRCLMNAAARERYGFAPEACWSEKIAGLLADILALPETPARYGDYMRALNAAGVTCVKEMVYDDHAGFMPVLEDLAEKGALTVRVSVQSQPVARPMNLALGRDLAGRLDGEWLNFTGYNQMTDRGVASELAELSEPYEGRDYVVAAPIDWGALEADVLAADAEGFRFTLHCQGDGAVRKTVDIYEKCAHDEAGRLVRRHGITDLECSDPEDLARFGAMGGICEVYPQIFALDERDELLGMLERRVGERRFPKYWNRRAMVDAGCTVCCGTDLPLLFPDAGSSIYHASTGRFSDGKPFNEGSTLTTAEVLEGWTANGAYDCGFEAVAGTLEPGKRADICVLDADVFALGAEKCREVGVALCVSDGRVVFNKR
jgi:hypothetical protein